jgi:hypothetical protein
MRRPQVTPRQSSGSYGNGSWTIVLRLVEDELEVARATAAVKLR